MKPSTRLGSPKDVAEIGLKEALKRRDVARFVDMYVAGEYDLDSVVSHHIAHDEINHGFAMMKDGASIRSVIVYGA